MRALYQRLTPNRATGQGAGKIVALGQVGEARDRAVSGPPLTGLPITNIRSAKGGRRLELYSPAARGENPENTSMTTSFARPTLPAGDSYSGSAGHSGQGMPKVPISQHDLRHDLQSGQVIWRNGHF